jgi:protease I
MAANTPSLSGKRVAIIATDGVEQVELLEPRKALDAAGAKTTVVSPKAGSIKGWNFTNWGDSINVDVTLNDASPDDYDALHIPGGVMNPDTLRTIPAAVDFVRAFFEAGKPVASICHGPWMLIEADVVHGRNVTSWPSVHTDLKNAGANWTDSQVVTDNGLVTSRKPDDIPAYNKQMIQTFSEGVREEQRASVHAGAAR